MKKRLLSALLALALVFVLLPTTALADTTPVTDENVKINGTPVTVGNDISLGDGNGTYSYDKSTRTLTLNNATITATGSNIGIDFCDTTNYVTYSVILTGENTVTSNDIAIETTSNTNLTFTGGGNLKAITKGNQHQAIRVYGTLTIDNSTLIAESSAYTATTVIWTLAMTGNNAKLEISNKSAANIVAGTAGPASKNIDWSNYQFTTGSYSGDALTERDPEVCSWGTLNEYLGFPTKKYSQYICIAKRTIPALQRTSDVFIAGEKAVVSQWTNIPADTGTGSYSYDADKKELTLKGITITRNNNNNVNHAIQFTKNGDYTINLEGTNNISSVANGICALNKAFYDDPANISVTISGSGSLNVIANTYAIDMQVGNLIFNNTGNITLATNTNYQVQSTVCNALRVKSGSITIDNTKYDIVGARQEKGYPTETISDSSAFTPDLLNGYTVDETTTLFKTITITPAAAKDSTIRYNGTTLKQGETITGENGGTATVDSKNNTITLDNFKGNYPLEFNAEFTPNSIILIGDSTLSAVETKYQNLTISGSGSLTVGSIKVHNQKASSDDKPNLTINGATVTVGTAELTTRAIDIDGDLTVTNGSLTATSTSDNVPTVQVGGNASFTGSTVTITNNSTALHKDAADATKGDSVSSALYVKGNINTDNANVTAKVENGGGNAIGAVGNITVNGSTVTAVNKGQKFTTIIAENVYVSGDSKITANNLNENPVYNGSYLAFPAIEGNIVNQNTDYSLKFEGQHNGTSVPKTTLAPGEQTTLYYYNVTITRGDEVTRTNSPVVIAGTTLLNDTYYTITNGSTVVANGSKDNYNAFYESATKTLKLNNAQISHSFAYEDGGGKDGAIIFTKFENYFIELSGENTISSTNTYAINCHRPDRTLTIKNAAEAENAKLTLTSNWMVICSIGGLNIQSDVTMVNTKRADYLMYVNGTFSYTGYNAYASTEASGSPLEVYNPQNYSTYKYLRVTKENLAPTTPTPQTPFTIDGIPAQFVDGGMIATTGVTATSSNNINLPIDRVKWYTFTPVFGSDGRMDSVSDKTEATGNFEAGKYYVVEIKFVQDLSPFESWDMKVSGWSDNDVYRQSVTARNDIEIYFLTPASAATHEHNWAEKYDTVYHWKMCTYDGCTAISGKAPHEWTGWWVDDYRPEVHAQRCNCGYLGSTHSTLKYVAINGEQHQKQCPVDGCDYKIESSTTAHVYAEGSNICTDCGYNKSAPCDHGNRAYTNNGDGTHKVTCKACGATIVEKQNHEFDPATGACVCGATQSGGNPTPDNPGTIVIIRPAEEEKPAQQPNPSTGANDLVGMAVAAAVAAALGSAALLRKHD